MSRATAPALGRVLQVAAQNGVLRSALLPTVEIAQQSVR